MYGYVAISHPTPVYNISLQLSTDRIHVLPPRMSDAALSKIANLIKVEDDLVKIGALKLQFIKERTSVDLKLNAASQNQIDSISDNLTNLKKSVHKLNSIKGNLGKINQLYDESITNVEDYDTIRQISIVNQFLIQTGNLYHDISNFKGFIQRLATMIQDELSIVQDDPGYSLDNIFRIHYNITQARNFQDYLQQQSSTLSDDLQSIIFKLVLPLQEVVKNFDLLLAEIIYSITEAAKEGNYTLAFKIIKIIEFEANEDLKFSLLNKLDLLKARDMRIINYGNFRGSKRNYRKFFYDKLQESLDEIFDKCVEHFAHDKILVFDNLNWLEDELVFVVNTLAPVFPPNWAIDTFVHNVYYNKLHDFSMEYINTDPPAEDLLKILSYDKHYSEFIESLNFTSSEQDESTAKTKKTKRSIIGEDLRNVVLEDYLKVIVIKMNEWNDNLIKQETQVFSQRESPPDIYTYHQVYEDENSQDELMVFEVDSEVFVLPDFKIPLTMLKEQADVAAESGYGKILVGVIEHWAEQYQKRVDNYLLLVEDEYDRYMSVYNNERFLIKESKMKRLFKKDIPTIDQDIENMTQEELARLSKPGLIEYLAALGNTYEITTERLHEKFLPKYRNKVHYTYQERIDIAFESVVAPTAKLNGLAIRCMVDIIVNDLYPAFSVLFTKTWYDDSKRQNSDELNVAEKIVETICEYMEELRGYASYEIYSVTFNIFLDSFIASYIRIGYENILYGEGRKIEPDQVKKFKSFSEAVSRDATILYGGLEHLFTRKDAAYLLNSLRAIEMLGELATCEDPMNFIPQMWENEILGSFYDCSVEYVRGICLCRKDMDKAQVTTLVSQLEQIKIRYQTEVEKPVIIPGTLREFNFYRK